MKGVTMAERAAPHVPVLRDRVVELLVDTPPGLLVDATVGAGGHAAAVVEARAGAGGPVALLGLDRDPDALALAEERLAPLRDRAEITLVRAGFDRLGEILDDLGDPPVAGVLLDLGVSSMQLDRPERGFSYRADGPLDMRMDPDAAVSADELVNRAAVDDLAAVIRRHGEERFAGRIARAIVAARPITGTARLAEVVRDAVPAAARRTGGHPATRTFQALRIAVNDELRALDRVLPVAIERLAPGGVIVTLAYHSLEDRRAKRAFADAARGCICPPDLPVCACGRVPILTLLTRGVERPSDAEVAANPRASAARLRAARRLDAAAADGARAPSRPRGRR